jgi:hypothetical protein
MDPMQMLEVDFRAQVAICREKLLDRLKVSFLSIGENKLRVVFVDSLTRTLPEFKKEQLAEQYENVVKWHNESITQALQ